MFVCSFLCHVVFSLVCHGSIDSHVRYVIVACICMFALHRSGTVFAFSPYVMVALY